VHFRFVLLVLRHKLNQELCRIVRGLEFISCPFSLPCLEMQRFVRFSCFSVCGLLPFLFLRLPHGDREPSRAAFLSRTRSSASGFTRTGPQDDGPSPTRSSRASNSALSRNATVRAFTGPADFQRPLTSVCANAPAGKLASAPSFDVAPVISLVLEPKRSLELGFDVVFEFAFAPEFMKGG
jgi:hypothetical protein